MCLRKQLQIKLWCEWDSSLGVLRVSNLPQDKLPPVLRTVLCPFTKYHANSCIWNAKVERRSDLLSIPGGFGDAIVRGCKICRILFLRTWLINVTMWTGSDIGLYLLPNELKPRLNVELHKKRTDYNLQFGLNQTGKARLYVGSSVKAKIQSSKNESFGRRKLK